MASYTTVSEGSRPTRCHRRPVAVVAHGWSGSTTMLRGTEDLFRAAVRRLAGGESVAFGAGDPRFLERLAKRSLPGELARFPTENAPDSSPQRPQGAQRGQGRSASSLRVGGSGDVMDRGVGPDTILLGLAVRPPWPLW